MLNKQYFRGLRSGSRRAAKIAKETNFKNFAGFAALRENFTEFATGATSR
jgi:hypothetical protein